MPTQHWKGQCYPIGGVWHVGFHSAGKKKPRKTEVIYSMLLELSSGTDMLKRLSKKGFISEYDDEEDKRSKRVMLTAQGERIVGLCQQKIAGCRNASFQCGRGGYQAMYKIAEGTEQKLSARFQDLKGQSFDHIYKDMTAAES